jgi:F-type H+-transporting ATPase subunit delta
MNNPRLAIRYAKSLVELAQEQKKLDEVYKDMMFLQSICKSNRDFVAVLNSPVIKADKKSQIIEAVTKGSIGNLTASFLKLLSVKGRDLNLPEIISAFIEQYNTIKKIKKVKITTAVAISDEIRNTLLKDFKTSDINDIQVDSVVDPEIIGGFILETDGKLVDASVSRDLKDIQKQFQSNDYIFKLR